MDINLGQVITQIFAFLIMLWVLKRYGWQPLVKVLQDRQDKIRSEFDDIAAQQVEVKQLNAEYQQRLKEIDVEARSKIQEAVLQGKKLAAAIQEEASAREQEMLEKTKMEIKQEMLKATNQLKTDLVKMVIATTEKILREKLDEPLQKKLISHFVNEADFQ